MKKDEDEDEEEGKVEKVDKKAQAEEERVGGRVSGREGRKLQENEHLEENAKDYNRKSYHWR